MLIKCPECDLQISDKAIVCPHCGFPLTNDAPKISRRKPKNGQARRTRLPNGFGQITKVSKKNLRKPYRAMITIGKTELGRPICKLLKPKAYFETYNDAYEALLEYNKNPYDLNDGITVEELYDRWSTEYFKTLKSSSSERTVRSAWSYCTSVYTMRAKDIRVRHIKGCMNTAVSPNVKSRIKSMFNLMLDYALEYEIVDKNYARTFNISDDIQQEAERGKKDHVAFTTDEMIKLWSNIDVVPYCDLVIIQCYTGWRPQELGRIKMSDVDLKNWLFVGGMKTDAGIDRTVPIHELIRPLVKRYYDRSVECQSEYLFNAYENGPNRFLSYDTYRRRFEKVMARLQIVNHRPHDPRKTFVTMAKNAKVDDFAIKRIVGHKIDDITEAIYTDRDVTWIIDEMKKINRTSINC